jgi:hypothetical protein
MSAAAEERIQRALSDQSTTAAVKLPLPPGWFFSQRRPIAQSTTAVAWESTSRGKDTPSAAAAF